MVSSSEEQIINIHFTQAESQRLDKVLVEHIPEFSRSRLQGLIADGMVTVNGQIASKAGQKLDAPAQICVRIPPIVPSSIEPENIPLDIVFENEDVMVVNKPAGMVVHPAAGHHSGTLVHAALAHDPNLEGIGGEQRPGVVHRLDKNTSGIILLAKNDVSHRYLQNQFRTRKIEKVYLALVDGQPPTPNGRIEAPIGRDPRDRKRMAVLSTGKGREATSSYLTLVQFPDHSMLEVHPITGRTHQIRLHLAFIGCPIVGDTIYGRRHPSLSLERHFLHAVRLTIILPGESEARTFEAPLPSELENVLTALRQQN